MVILVVLLVFISVVELCGIGILSMHWKMMIIVLLFFFVPAFLAVVGRHFVTIPLAFRFHFLFQRVARFTTFARRVNLSCRPVLPLLIIILTVIVVSFFIFSFSLPFALTRRRGRIRRSESKCYFRANFGCCGHFPCSAGVASDGEIFKQALFGAEEGPQSRERTSS